MRWLPLLIGAVACGGASEDDSGTAVDPRKDASTWPTELGTADRPSMVFAPSNYDGESDLPLVLLLHGYGANGMVQDFVYQLVPRVDEFGFVLILPDGTVDEGGSHFWNATELCCDFYGTEVDDSAYLAGLLDEAEAAFPIDPDRVTVAGHSNGGYMSYRMACDHSERLAAIAPLAGATFGNEADCKATNPVSVLHIHGTDDLDVPYEAGAWAVGAVPSLERWTDRAGCTGTANDGTRDYEVIVDGSETKVTQYTGCESGFTGELWQMQGVGHLPGFSDQFRDDMITWLLAQRRI